MKKEILQIEKLDAQTLLGKLNHIKNELYDIKRKVEPRGRVSYMTRKEVAALFKVSDGTVLEWTRKGILTSYRIGNQVLYKEHEIEVAAIPE